MAWDTLKESILRELSEQIDQRSDDAHRDWLHHLARVFYGRFAAEDMRGRSVENIYGCLYGLLHFMQKQHGEAPKARIFNPELGAHGWENKNTVVVLLCKDMPFCTGSIQGELNRRGIRVHTITSCNLVSTRDEQGNLTAVLNSDTSAEVAGLCKESLIYFEIGRQ